MRLADSACECEIVAAGPLPGQNGVVVSHGSRVVAMDVFASEELLAQAWESLVRGYFAKPVTLPCAISGGENGCR